MGLLSGYIWASRVKADIFELDVYLYASAKREITLPSGKVIQIDMLSEMPWTGSVSISIKNSSETSVATRLPIVDWMENKKVGTWQRKS